MELPTVKGGEEEGVVSSWEKNWSILEEELRMLEKQLNI
jgi:hypothetical protein